MDVSGIAVDDVGRRRPPLDDVFLTLTGHAAVDETDTEEETNSAPALPTGSQPTTSRPTTSPTPSPEAGPLQETRA